jgi:hypothetical protein
MLNATTRKLPPSCYEHDVLGTFAQPGGSGPTRRGRLPLKRSPDKSVRINGYLRRYYRSGYFLGSHMDPQLLPAPRPRAGLTSPLRNVKATESHAGVQGSPSLVQISSLAGNFTRHSGSMAIPNTATRTGQLAQGLVPAHELPPLQVSGVSPTVMFNPSLKRSRIPEPEVSVSSPDIKNEAAQDEGVPAKRARKNAKSWSCFYFKRAWLSVCQEFGLPQVSGGQLLNQFQHQPPLLFRLTSELTSEI